MNRIDETFMHWLNSYSQRWVHVDHLISLLSFSLLFKGAWVMGLFWYFWFQRRGESDSRRDRTIIIAALVGGAIAVGIAKLLGKFCPHRDRPLYAMSWFKPPAGLLDRDLTLLRPLNSFPSDHASIFFGLVTGLCFLSLRAGLAAAVGVIVLILLPRVYLGFHYPTDVLAGIGLGIVVSLITITIFTYNNAAIRLADGLLDRKDRNPAMFYAIAFLATLEYASLFEDLRHVFHLP